MEFWFSICFSFIGVSLSLFTYLTKREKQGAIIAIIISFFIAGICFFIGISNKNQENNPESFGNQISNTISSLQNNESAQNISSTTMFTNYFETHTSVNNNIDCTVRVWDSTKDKDIRGSYHEYEQGLKLCAFKMFYIYDYTVTSDIHLIYNKNYTGNPNFSGKIVVGNDSSGTKSTADVCILIDGIETWKTAEKISGLTISPIEFNINTKNCNEEIIIRTNFYLPDDSLTLGFF